MTGKRPRRSPPGGATARPERALGPIVSSAHLAAGSLPALSEFEFGMMLADHAFERWIVRCMAAAGVAGLSPIEVLVLHTVRHRARPKKIADICLVLSVEDTHIVTYAVKKLAAAGLVATLRSGKEKLVAATETGAAACERYRQIRERLLVSAVRATGTPESALSELGALLRALSGHYDQAARAATSL